MLKSHPAADIWPMMDAARFAEHKADIEANGQIEPITLCDGMILDGRNRYKACTELGIEPRTRTFEGNPWKQAWSLNGMRRDVPDMQRAAIKIINDKKSDEYEGKLARQRKSIDAAANEKRSAATKEQHQVSKPRSGETMVGVHNEHTPKQTERPGRKARASEANVSTATQARVEVLSNNRPDLLAKVASGELKGTEALRQMKKDSVSQNIEALPKDKFGVIYADPPWAYNDKRHGETIGATGAEHHYPTMTLSELKVLDIPSLCHTDCVLWMWATCPLLEDALELVKAWGFKYKAQFVWDKVGHNMGHYNSVRHELLFVCTRGSMTPENVKLFDSVQTIEKTRKHSEKPEEFRDIINTLYPSSSKIELFRRGDAPEGWSVWGNESNE